MTVRGEITHDSELPQHEARFAPRLILLFNGTAILRMPINIRLSATPTVIGRESELLHTILCDDNRMSREHAIVKSDTAHRETWITDNQSRNGTFVNGVRITQTPLYDGDVLRLGNSLFLFRHAQEPTLDGPPGKLLGSSSAMARLRYTLSRVAPTGASILLLGETGTGKEVASRYIHDLSRGDKPFVAVNCSAVPESLAESQFFGHTKGSFTGAGPHTGFFRAAQDGTLLLDEIGDLAESLQPKLLRVLEERLIFPVGSVVGQPLEARLLFATNRNLLDAVRAGKFRADLYSRIAEVSVELPPLRDRREDLFVLLQHSGHIKPTLNLPASLAELMLLHNWPFNVRELVKVATELSAVGDAAAVEARLRNQKSPPTLPRVASPASSDPKRQQLLELLRTHKGNVAAVARILNCPRKNIYRWLDELAINLADFRS